MRYKSTGNVHKDFHLATNTSIHFVLEKYGMDFLRELFRRTAQQVYRDIYENLKSGQVQALLEHWKYYYEREGGRFRFIDNGDEIVFYVQHCPAASHLKERGIPLTEEFYLQASLMNEAWSENTPFEIATEIMGEAEYKSTIRRKDCASE